MADRSGQTLGHYRLARLLGQGGFAEVYLGEHIYLGTQAAIKLLHTQLAGEGTEAFRREARTIARLVHPHIVRVFDFGIEGETPYLVMDYAPNGTIRTRHPKGVVLPLPTILSYVKQTASALQYAHDEHFIHRDVKPGNLLVGRGQEILLGDFGTALLAQTSRSQSMQDVAGTASYMAPEQFQGKPRPASDQYALAVMVYEWLTGDCPFHGSFVEIASQHLFTPPPPLQSRTPTISPAVEQIVLTGLAKDPHQRFGSVQAFATAFEQASSATLPAPRIVSSPFDEATEMAHLPDRSQSVLPPEPISSSGETRNSEESAGPSRQTAHTPFGPSLSPSVSTRQSESTTTPAASKTNGLPQPRRSSSRLMPLLLVGAALLVILGSGSFFFITNSINQANSVSAQQTQTSRATTQAHTRATQQAQVGATATTQAVRVAATATATARPNPYSTQQGKLVIDDPLRDNSQGHGWEEGGSCQFSHNAYHILMQSGYSHTCRALSTHFTNFTYQVDVSFLKGQQGASGGTGSAVDIFFRGTTSQSLPDSVNGYYFTVYMNGAYYLHICQGYTNTGSINCGQTLFPTNGVGTGFASSFHQGLHATNTLAITAQGKTFNAYINGQRVLGPVNDDNNTYSGGTIGLGASAGDNDTDVAFTNARVWTS